MQEQTSQKCGFCKTYVFAAIENSRWEKMVSARPSFDLKVENVCDKTVPAATILLPKTATEYMAVVIEAMMSIYAVYDIDLDRQTHFCLPLFRSQRDT